MVQPQFGESLSSIVIRAVAGPALLDCRSNEMSMHILITTSDAAVASRLTCNVWPQLQASNRLAQLAGDAPLRVAKTVEKNWRKRKNFSSKTRPSSPLTFLFSTLFLPFSFRVKHIGRHESICVRRRRWTLKMDYLPERHTIVGFASFVSS